MCGWVLVQTDMLEAMSRWWSAQVALEGRVVTRGTADANLHVEDCDIQILEPEMFAFDMLQMDRVGIRRDS